VEPSFFRIYRSKRLRTYSRASGWHNRVQNYQLRVAVPELASCLTARAACGNQRNSLIRATDFSSIRETIRQHRLWLPLGWLERISVLTRICIRLSRSKAGSEWLCLSYLFPSAIISSQVNLLSQIRRCTLQNSIRPRFSWNRNFLLQFSLH